MWFAFEGRSMLNVKQTPTATGIGVVSPQRCIVCMTCMMCVMYVYDVYDVYDVYEVYDV